MNERTYGEWDNFTDWEIIDVPRANKNITIKEVVEMFSPEELIAAIGEENAESVLRTHKLKKIRKKP